MWAVRGFDELIDEANEADVTGWGFEWLSGRATEERPPWGYSRLLARRLASVRSALDIDTGGGEVIAEVPALPDHMCVVESWPPNAARARELLGPRGVTVVEAPSGGSLPVGSGVFELVTSRHPVAANWPEIGRVLASDGRYLAQHVGPGSAFDLIEHFVETTPEQRRSRHPDEERAAAEAAGLEVVDLRTARCRMQFFDIGAVVYILRKCVWWVPDFDVHRYEAVLRRLDETIRVDGRLVAHSTRQLFEARLRAR